MRNSALWWEVEIHLEGWPHGEGVWGGGTALPFGTSGGPAAFPLPLHMKGSGVWGLIKI